MRGIVARPGADSIRSGCHGLRAVWCRAHRLQRAGPESRGTQAGRALRSGRL